MTTETRVSPSETEGAVRCAEELARGAAGDRRRGPAPLFISDPVWRSLRALGTQLWLDTGDLEEASAIWTADFSSLTTNNTLVNKEVQKGLFDDLVPEAGRALRSASPKMDEATLLYEVGFVLNCRNALRLVDAFDAHVSVELHPGMADDVAASVAYGRRYYAVCPERFFVKVPLTPAGFLAARQLGRDGIPVNYTLGFSARQNYLIALFSRPAFVNVFMGRLNAFVTDNRLGDGKNVGEKATLATQRVVNELLQRDAAPSRLIGASMRSAQQLHDLAGLDVFTIPTPVARDFHEQMATDPRPIVSAIANDPSVTLNAGVDARSVGLEHLWEVPEAIIRFGKEISIRDTSGWDGDAFADAARKAGLRDLFPDWTAADRERMRADGKIPRYEAWKERVRSGEVGLDALMSLSALYSFVTDQQQLDDRIRKLLSAAGVL